MSDIITNNAGLIRRIAGRYAAVADLDGAVSFDDMMQAGAIGVMLAEHTYSPSAGKTWASWAAWHISNEIKSLFRLRRREWPLDLTAARLDAPLLADDADGDTLGDVVPDDSLPDADAALLADEVRATVREAVARLPDEARDAVTLYDLAGLSFAATAANMGSDVEAVKKARRRGLRALEHDRRMRQLDLETRFYAHKGVEAFNRDWTSTVEEAVLWRDRQSQ